MSERGDRVRDAVARAWQQARPLVLQHLETLETAARALRTGALSDPQRREAESLAHQLAGSLGTYGFQDASAHALSLERLLGEPGLARADAHELLAHVREMRRILEERGA